MKCKSFRVFLILVTMYDFELYQMNVKTIYLRNDLKNKRKKIYMRVFSKVDVKNSRTKKANIICRIKKSLYDLKQFERFWNKIIVSFLKSQSFETLNANQNILIR